MLVKPFPPRHKINDVDDALVVSIPSLKVWPLIFVLSIWSLMWLAFESGMIASIFTEDASWFYKSFLLAFLAGLTLMGVFLIYNLLWQLIGREEIKVTSEAFMISHVVLGYRRSKKYLSEHIRDLGLARLTTKDVVMSGGPFMQISTSGSISFDYGARTIRFGGSMDIAEAKQIIAEIVRKYPQYKTP